MRIIKSTEKPKSGKYEIDQGGSDENKVVKGKLIGDYGVHRENGFYTLTHIPSGFCLGRAKLQRDALAFALHLHGSGIEIVADKDGRVPPGFHKDDGGMGEALFYLMGHCATGYNIVEGLSQMTIISDGAKKALFKIITYNMSTPITADGFDEGGDAFQELERLGILKKIKSECDFFAHLQPYTASMELAEELWESVEGQYLKIKE